MGTFDTNSIKILYGEKNQGNITIGVYGGTASIKFFDPNKKGAPVTRVITDRFRLEMKEAINKVIANGPGTKVTFTKSIFEKVANTYKIDTVVTVGMNDSKLIYLSIQSRELSAPATIIFKSPKSDVYNSGNEVDDATDSKQEALAFVEFLYYNLPVFIGLSKDADTMRKIADSRKRAFGGAAQPSNPHEDIPF
jgi:hypothetical protein